MNSKLFGSPPERARATWVAEIPLVADESALHAALQYALRLPAWYGRNFDALEECLRDLGHLGAEQVLIYHHVLPGLEPERMDIYRALLKDASKESRYAEVVIRVWFPEERAAQSSDD